MESRFKVGDLVACYLTSSDYTTGLFQWGMVLEVSETLQDILVLDNGGYTNWYPATRWVELNEVPKEKVLDIYGILA
jgi:hypothetical protein